MKLKGGFTLVEVILTVIVIGILATLAVVGYARAVEKARQAEAIEVLHKAYGGYQRLLLYDEDISGSNPLSWSRLGMSNPNGNPSRYFDYLIFPNSNNPTGVLANRTSDPVNKWLQIDFSNGQLTRSSHY